MSAIESYGALIPNVFIENRKVVYNPRQFKHTYRSIYSYDTLEAEILPPVQVSNIVNVIYFPIPLAPDSNPFILTPAGLVDQGISLTEYSNSALSLEQSTEQFRISIRSNGTPFTQPVYSKNGGTLIFCMKRYGGVSPILIWKEGSVEIRFNFVTLNSYLLEIFDGTNSLTLIHGVPYEQILIFAISYSRSGSTITFNTVAISDSTKQIYTNTVSTTNTNFWRPYTGNVILGSNWFFFIYAHLDTVYSVSELSRLIRPFYASRTVNPPRRLGHKFIVEQTDTRGAFIAIKARSIFPDISINIERFNPNTYIADVVDYLINRYIKSNFPTLNFSVYKLIGNPRVGSDGLVLSGSFYTVIEYLALKYDFMFNLVNNQLVLIGKSWIDSIAPVSVSYPFYIEGATTHSAKIYTVKSRQPAGTVVETFTATGTQKRFKLKFAPSNLTVEINSVLQQIGVDYVYINGTKEIEFRTPPASGSTVKVTYDQAPINKVSQVSPTSTAYSEVVLNTNETGYVELRQLLNKLSADQQTEVSFVTTIPNRMEFQTGDRIAVTGKTFSDSVFENFITTNETFQDFRNNTAPTVSGNFTFLLAENRSGEEKLYKCVRLIDPNAYVRFSGGASSSITQPAIHFNIQIQSGYTNGAIVSFPNLSLRINAGALTLTYWNGSAWVDLNLGNIVIGQWEHITLAPRGNTYSVYRNGSFVGSITFTLTLTSSVRVVIGNTSGLSGFYGASSASNVLVDRILITTYREGLHLTKQALPTVYRADLLRIESIEIEVGVMHLYCKYYGWDESLYQRKLKLRLVELENSINTFANEERIFSQQENIVTVDIGKVAPRREGSENINTSDSAWRRFPIYDYNTSNNEALYDRVCYV